MIEICTKLFTKILNWIDNNIHIIALSVPILLLLVAIYSYINQPQEVTTETQTQAETVQGVQTAADNAKIKLEESQKKEVVETIKEIRTTEQVPVYIVKTTGKDVVQETEKAVKDNKADFAIVTSKDNPDEKVNLEEIPKDTKVELNQYNINAFKISKNPTKGDNIEGKINVTKNKVEKIEITKLPNKTQYSVGEKFDATGMVVKAKYLDGTEKEITDYKITKTESLKIGDTTITIEYVPRYDDVSEITSDFWIDMLTRLCIAKAKIAVGRIRTRYSQSNALWAQDGETMLSEGNAELSDLHEKLEASTQLVYPVD